MEFTRYNDYMAGSFYRVLIYISITLSTEIYWKEIINSNCFAIFLIFFIQFLSTISLYDDVIVSMISFSKKTKKEYLIQKCFMLIPWKISSGRLIIGSEAIIIDKNTTEVGEIYLLDRVTRYNIITTSIRILTLRMVFNADKQE
uniref:Uncharacterized protein n=1 Tax=Strongyloides venezuelensis TaxID=75913 RepID=A0A0K0G584_STRVS